MANRSGANIKKALFRSGVNNVDCTIHNIQLVVKCGISSQKSIMDITSKCRTIAVHFNHSTTAQDELQNRLQTPTLSVIHDTPHTVEQDISDV